MDQEHEDSYEIDRRQDSFCEEEAEQEQDMPIEEELTERTEGGEQEEAPTPDGKRSGTIPPEEASPEHYESAEDTTDDIVEPDEDDANARLREMYKQAAAGELSAGARAGLEAAAAADAEAQAGGDAKEEVSGNPRKAPSAPPLQYTTQPSVNGNGRPAVHRASYTITPRSTMTPRSTRHLGNSPGRRSASYSRGASGSVVAEDENAQRLRHGSMIAAARYNAVRRNSSLLNTIGEPGDVARSPSHSSRRIALTEGESYAVAWMTDNDTHRQEVYERAQQLKLSKEAFMVELELERELANYDRRWDLEITKEKKFAKSAMARDQRTENAAKRRCMMERQRIAAINARVERMNAMLPDPYQQILARRRYSTPASRGESPMNTPRHQDSTRVLRGSRALGANGIVSQNGGGSYENGQTTGIRSMHPRRHVDVNNVSGEEAPRRAKSLPRSAWRSQSVDHVRAWR